MIKRTSKSHASFSDCRRCGPGRSALRTANHPGSQQHRKHKGLSLLYRSAFKMGLLMLFFTFLGVLSSNAQTNSNAPSRFDYSAFRIISNRNIFNPRRSAQYVPSERTTRRSTSRTDSFALVGTMSYDAKGPLAFFEGTSAEYRKVLKPNDSIAGFTVAAIEVSHVKLASPTNQVDLRVGMQLNHDENGSWHVAERTETVAPTPSYPNSSSRSSTGRPSFTGTRPTATSTNNVSTNTQAGDPQPVGDGTLPPDSIEPAEPGAPAPGSAPAGNANDVLEMLRRRAAAERGEGSQ